MNPLQKKVIQQKLPSSIFRAPIKDKCFSAQSGQEKSYNSLTTMSPSNDPQFLELLSTMNVQKNQIKDLESEQNKIKEQLTKSSDFHG